MIFGGPTEVVIAEAPERSFANADRSRLAKNREPSALQVVRVVSGNNRRPSIAKVKQIALSGKVLRQNTTLDW